MKTELIKSSHAVGESNFHIQLTPAFRRPIFADENVAELTLAYILEKMSELRVEILGYGFGPEHLHLFFANVRFVSEVELVRQIKGFSSRMMRKNFWSLFNHLLWGKKSWTEGYFCRSIGATTTEAVEYYIKHGQDKHLSDYETYQMRLD